MIAAEHSENLLLYSRERLSLQLKCAMSFKAIPVSVAEVSPCFPTPWPILHCLGLPSAVGGLVYIWLFLGP